jgi:hypothetical protein
VACTYEDPWIAEVLSLRRKHALVGGVDLDACPVWMFDLWCDLEGLLADKREAARKG